MTTQASPFSENHLFLQKFRRINQAHVYFHLCFSTLIFFELITFTLFFSFFARSTLMAFYLAGIFLTIFTYLVLIFYLQTRRPERLMMLRDEYLSEWRAKTPYRLGSSEFVEDLENSISFFSDMLSIAPLQIRWINYSQTISELTEKFRIWTQWKDLLKLKEFLHFYLIQEKIEWIKKEPTSLEAHAALASSYLALAELYRNPSILSRNDKLNWVPPEYSSDLMRQKSESALKRALEEYEIMDNLKPADPWILAQRAAIFHDLEQVEKEMNEYEKILSLAPPTPEVLLRLGTLCFKRGFNSRGLKIYEELLRADPAKATQLIDHYDSYNTQ